MRQRINQGLMQVKYFFGKTWFKIGLLVLFAVVLHRKDVSFQFNFNTGAAKASPTATPLENTASGQLVSAPPKPGGQASSLSPIPTSIPAPPLKKRTPEELAKLKRQQKYVERFASVAISEMKKYGIPASITLAQGIVETNAGSSTLATKHNNHFGMKCFSKKCKKGHCTNFSDDSHKDFFVRYESAWFSFRAHSELLSGKRYRPLHEFSIKDYKSWAKGLKKAGYATDPSYADKLIKTIEELELYKYDAE